MHNHSRLPAALLAIIIFSGGGYIFAQMGPNDDRLIPYQGTLYSGVDTAQGEHDFRFGLFSTEPTSNELDCLLADPPSCGLWHETQTNVLFSSGSFSVALGEDTTLSDTILAQSELYVGVALKRSDETVFEKLGTASRILPTAWASRAAAANDFRVEGALTAANVTAANVTATAVNATTVTAATNIIAPTVNATTVNATTVSAGVIRSNGGISAAGRLLADCPGGMNRIRPASAVCVDAASSNAGINWYDGNETCHNVGKRLCTVGEASAAVRTGTTTSYDINSVNRWVWVDAVNNAPAGFDHGACHVQMNFNEGGTLLGEANCQVAGRLPDPNIGLLCCYEQ